MYRTPTEFLDSIKTNDTVSVVVPSMSHNRESEIIEVVVKRGRKFFTVTAGRASIMGAQFSLKTGVKNSEHNYRPFIVESEEIYRTQTELEARKKRVINSLGSMLHRDITADEIAQLEAIEAAIVAR